MKINFKTVNKSLSGIDQKIENLRTENTQLKQRCTNFENRLALLECKPGIESGHNEPNRDNVNIQKRDLAIILINLPKFNIENAIKLVNAAANKLKIDFDHTEIMDLYRVQGKNERFTHIVILLNSTLARAKWLAKRHVSLLASNLYNSFPSSKIFISERTTQIERDLFTLIETSKYFENFKYKWMTRGVIYVRESDTSSALKFQSRTDYDKYVKSTSITEN